MVKKKKQLCSLFYNKQWISHEIEAELLYCCSTLFSPGRGSMPVILRPTRFLPLVERTWICVWYLRRWWINKHKRGGKEKKNLKSRIAQQGFYTCVSVTAVDSSRS